MRSEQKHTPGPWLIAGTKAGAKPDQKEDRLIYVKVNGRHYHIAETFQFRNGEFCGADGVSIANADHIITCVNALEGKNPEAVAIEALIEIEKGEGRYSMDQLIHANNTIENMKSIARAALAKLKEQK